MREYPGERLAPGKPGGRASLVLTELPEARISPQDGISDDQFRWLRSCGSFMSKAALAVCRSWHCYRSRNDTLKTKAVVYSYPMPQALTLTVRNVVLAYKRLEPVTRDSA